ncbi:MAG TPA: diguanylate cyclase [Povalibacter sp.]|nr:diguanylate cyclase [Povalibacter sp.]
MAGNAQISLMMRGPDRTARAAMNALDTRRWIEFEKLRLIVANLNVALTFSFAAGCLLVIVLRKVQPALLLVLWVSVTALISVMRYLHAREFRHTPEDAVDLRHWRARVDFGTAVSGLWWGCGAVMLFPDDLPHQVYIAFILAGMGAAAMTSYAALRRTYFLFLLPSVLPLMGRIAMEGTEVHISMAVLVGMFLIVVARSAINTERMIATVLELRAQNLELTRALHHEATHDALVDLVNYREFHARLQAEAAASFREKHPYALLFVDLDHFKQINDTAGHAAGDDALRRVAAVLKAELRASDTAARVGGDEFAVLLPRCPRERAQVVAENILGAIRALEFTVAGRTLRLGASIGVAYTDAGEHDAQTTLRAADAACYEAKRGGRNRVEMNHSDPGYEVSGRFQLEDIARERSGDPQR